MPITQILLTAARRIATYTITPDANNVDEGSSLTITVGGNNISNGTYYWTIEDGSSEFDTQSGEFSITDNVGSFSVTPDADYTAEGSETFVLYLRSDSITGTVLASETIAINDTSNAPAAVMSLIAADYAGSGGLWADSSGFNHPGTLINGPTFANTVPKHFTFNRTNNQWVYVDSLGDLPRWTIESWFRLSEPLSNTAVTTIITTTYNDDINNNFGVINYTLSNYVEGMQTGGNNHLTVGFYSEGQWYTTQGFIPTVGEWYHVVGTYDGTTIKQWVNGTLDGTRVVTATPSSAGGPVRIARRWDYANNDAQYFFPGDIAVAKVYNGVISDEEIVAAYNTTRSTYSV